MTKTVTAPLSDNLQGARWILLSCVAATGMSALVKGLASDLHAFQITFVRCLLGLVLVLPLVARERLGGLITRHWKAQLIRALLLTVALNCGYYVLTKLPLATATVLFFTTPLFITMLAQPFLGERVGWRRWSATLVGFAGTLIVMRPSPAGLDPAMLIAIASAFCFAVAIILGRKLSASESPRSMLLYFGVIAAIGSLPAAVTVWQAPSTTEWALLAVATIFATARTYSDLRGYAIGEISAVAPIQYLRIVLVGTVGYLFFAEVPDRAALLGATVIVASTLYIARREARLKRDTSLEAA